MSPDRFAQLREHAQRGNTLSPAQAQELLAEVERLREAKDGAYHERNQVVALVVRMALVLGLKAGIGQHEDKPGEAWEDDWRTVVHVELPTGQVSWHFHDSERGLLEGLPDSPFRWDGHDTPEKYFRVSGSYRERGESVAAGIARYHAEVDRLRGDVAAWKDLAGEAIRTVTETQDVLKDALVSLNEARERLEAG